MHERGGVATLVESVVFTEEKQRAMGDSGRNAFLLAGGLASKCLMLMYGRKSKMAHIPCSVSRVKQKG